MIVYAEESFAAAAKEVDALAADRLDETRDEKYGIFNKVNNEVYIAAEKLGRIIFVTARKNGELVGCKGAMILPHPNKKDILIAIVTPYAVSTSIKNRVFVLKRLTKLICSLAKRRGAVYYVDRTHPGPTSAARLYEAMGFEEYDKTYILRL